MRSDFSLPDEQKMKKIYGKVLKFVVIYDGWDWYIIELLLNCKFIERQMSIWRVHLNKMFGRINKYLQDLLIGGQKITAWEAGHAQISLC